MIMASRKSGAALTGIDGNERKRGILVKVLPAREML